VIDVGDVVTECRDPTDNKFLELALSGRGSHVVTGDSDLLVLHPFRKIAIVTPQSFLGRMCVQDEIGEPGEEHDRNEPGEST
jgi:predicted nucleic acid-binding protein